MEIKRKIYSKIIEWKQTCNGTKALLINESKTNFRVFSIEVKSSKNY